MGRRAAAKTVRRTPPIRRRRVDEDERTLSQRIRRVDDLGFESESEQDARDAKFIEVPERVERNERGGGFGVRETQGNRGEDGVLEKRDIGGRRRRERGETVEGERNGGKVVMMMHIMSSFLKCI